ncbi:hypothetical protein [Nocardioides ferulae]|uniref:hypothetical protein n=1 Tax=Nocardioides ferulae TaxID=2340821 RepID=UPI000F86CDF8|nr:hypothetical protein [Nocardioides ferulae]
MTERTGGHVRQPTVSGDLGPMPTPRIDPGEPPPGGADAVTEGAFDAPLVPDLSPDLNPETKGDSVPDPLREGEDTSTEATAGRSDEAQEPDEPEKESPV